MKWNDESLTACKYCKHLLNLDRGSDHCEWYNQYCVKNPEPMKFNPLTGKMETSGFRHIREVNYGNCKDFEE